MDPHRGPGVRLDLDLGPLLLGRLLAATSATRPSRATPPSPATPHACGWGRSSTAPATGTRPCSPTPSPRSTTSPAGEPTSGSAPAGRSTSTPPTASPSRRTASASTSSRSRSRPSGGCCAQDVTDFSGTHVQLTEARCEPKPVQAELPIWVGGGGERRTLRIAAKYADGWNVPFVSPETIAHKRAVLADHCSTVGRDPVGDPHGGQRRSLPGRRRPRRAVRPARRAGAAGRDDRFARPARATHGRVRRRPAPIRSTSPCGPRGT